VGWGGEEGAGVAVGLGDYLDGTGSFRCFVARNIAPGLEELEEIVSSLAGSDMQSWWSRKTLFDLDDGDTSSTLLIDEEFQFYHM